MNTHRQISTRRRRAARALRPFSSPLSAPRKKYKKTGKNTSRTKDRYYPVLHPRPPRSELQMPVLEHVFAAIFNFVAFPSQIPYPPPAGSSSSKTSTFKSDKNCENRPIPRRSSSATGNLGGVKRPRMDAIKRRTRVFSMSLPTPPPSLMAGPPPPGIQTPTQRGSATQTQRDPQPSNLAPQPSTSTSIPPASTRTPPSSETTLEAGTNSKGKGAEKGWVTWANEVDVVGSTSVESLTKLVVNGVSNDNASVPNHTTRSTTRSQEKKKGVKRKRSESSIVTISSSFSPLSKKLSGLMSRTPKKAKTIGTGLSEQADSDASDAQSQVPEVKRGVQNSGVDMHAALRDGGCRLVGSSLDFDDLYTDKPDDALLNISSALRLLTGEQQQIPLSARRGRLTTESITYCLWVACHKSVTVFPYTNDKEEEVVAREERECYALQLFMAELGLAILDLLPLHGVLHVPVDPRLSNNVVDTIHHTLYLVEAFGEVGADLSRLVFDVPATHAGIHAGQILTLEHKLHINYTLVCDLAQAAACLPTRPYGISVPVRLMKNVGDERVRVAGTNAHHAGGIASTIPPSISHTLMSAVGGKGRASISMPGELDARDHPAFETIRSITRLVAIHTPGVLVSARDVDFRRFVNALKGVHAVSLTQQCLVQQRWYAYLNEGASLFIQPTDAQRRRADDRAHAIKFPSTERHQRPPNGSEGVEGAPWETALREEVNHGTAKNPKTLRRYVDREWVSGSGLSKAVRDLAFASATPGTQPPEGFMGALGVGGKRNVLAVMEGALEEECKIMGNLHRLLADYLEKRFSPAPVVLEGRKRSSRESTEEV